MSQKKIGESLGLSENVLVIPQSQGTPLQQVIKRLAESYWLNGRIDRQHFEALAQEAFEAGQAAQRERDAPYMQHKEGCGNDFSNDAYSRRIVLGLPNVCTCGLDAVLSSSLTEQA